MPQPTIVSPVDQRANIEETPAVSGTAFAIQEWQGSAPDELHVHHRDDIAWYVIEGTLRFRFSDQTVDAPAGSTVFIPAGVPHTYGVEPGPAARRTEGHARYLVTAPPRLFELFEELRAARRGHPHTNTVSGTAADIYRRYDSELLE